MADDDSKPQVDFEINEATYLWSVRLFSLLRRVAKVNLKLHDSEKRMNDGDIFLFNHFARFETFIPQYFVHQETGAYCRSVASAEFFAGDDAFGNYLTRVGAVPNDHPRLLPFLAAEILRGRKVIVFPEGGMVKDRRVLGPKGGYSIYSRSALERRKQHSGAAVLGLLLDCYKRAVLQAHQRHDVNRLEIWRDHLSLNSIDELIQAVSRPTRIVPANITFYPIRIRDNLLRQGAELLSRGLSRRLSEELLIEGNILLRDTDMDIRLSEPVVVDRVWRWWDRLLIDRVVKKIDSLDDAFALGTASRTWDGRLFSRTVRRHAERIRDDYMHRMYTGVTVNLSHLASTLIGRLVDTGVMAVESLRFKRTLYLAVKYAQGEADLYLHRSLNNPSAYKDLPDGGESQGLRQFLQTTGLAGLVEADGTQLRFLEKLKEEHDFDEIRLENLIEVYANEAAPMAGAMRAVERAYRDEATLSNAALAGHRFDDEHLMFDWDKRRYNKEKHQEINAKRTATESGAPFFLRPAKSRKLGILALHGFLASPAEMRGFADAAAADNYPVLGVRLKGHGTSPWDLHERRWEEWYESAERGLRILKGVADEVCVVGFSTGGALALLLAADRPEEVNGVAAISVPLRFRNRNMRFVPLVHKANKIVGWVSPSQGIMPFIENDSEHPNVNYRHMPVHALNELRGLVDNVSSRLSDVTCPVCLVQSNDDVVVEPQSVDLLRKGLVRTSVEVTVVPSQRHGILYEDIGATRPAVFRFLERMQVPTKALPSPESENQ